MPRHPPCALTSLTTSIQGSNKLPFRSLRVGYPWCLAQRFPSRNSAGITELYPSNARNLSPTRPQGTGWKLKMPSTTTKLSKNFSPESAKSRILYSGDFDVNRGYARDPRKRRQPTREVTYSTRNWFAGKWRLGVFPRHRNHAVTKELVAPDGQICWSHPRVARAASPVSGRQNRPILCRSWPRRVRRQTQDEPNTPLPAAATGPTVRRRGS